MLAKLKEKRSQRRADMETFPVVKKLRRRLAVIFTVLTSVILLAVLGLNLYLGLNRVEEQVANEFLNTVSFMAQELSHVEDGGTVDFRAAEEINGVSVVAAVNSEPAYVSEPFETMDGEALLIEMNDDFETWAFGSDSNLTFAIYTLAVEVYLQDMTEDNMVMVAGAVSAGEYGDSTNVAVEEGDSAYLVEGEDVAIYHVGMATTSTIFDDAGRMYDGLVMEYYNEENENFYQLMVLNDPAALTNQKIWLVAEYAALMLAGVLLLALASWQMARFVLKPTLEGLKRQAEFVAAASHELRSPLTVLRTSLAASRVAPDEEKADRYQTAAETEAERMSRLVDDLLLLAGGDAGSWKLHTESVEADTLLIEAVEQFRPVAKKQGVKLVLCLPDEALGNMKGDADRLHQILVVLLDNALQYAPQESSIEVCAAAKRGKLEISVADHGPGIPDEEKDKVFARFYRADKSRSDKKHFGLGLSVAKELAELHGGSLTVRDTEGGGATFRLVLPAD